MSRSAHSGPQGKAAASKTCAWGPRGKWPPRRAVPGAPGVGGSLKATCCFLHMLLRHVRPPSQVFPAGAEGQTEVPGAPLRSGLTARRPQRETSRVFSCGSEQ